MQPVLDKPSAAAAAAGNRAGPESSTGFEAESGSDRALGAPRDHRTTSHTASATSEEAASTSPKDASDPFRPGPFAVVQFLIPQTSKAHPEGPPKPLLVFAPLASAPEASAVAGQPGPSQGGPASAGTATAAAPTGVVTATTAAPVLVFLHGFNLKPQFYSQLLAHVASHGFLAVAPELYGFSSNPDAKEEIKNAVRVIEWLKGNFSQQPNSITSSSSKASSDPPLLPPDFNRLCVAGHSRGGKEAYGVALGLGGASAGAKAVLVLDPVDGMSNTTQTPPPILKHQPSSLALGAPVLVVGSGLGPCGKWGIFPPCAPEQMGHKFFYSDAKPPAYHVRAREFGHMDMLDDVTGGISGKATYAVCKNGVAREPMRTFCAGISVAFLKGALQGEEVEFRKVLTDAAFKIEVDEVFIRAGETVATS